MQDNATPIHLLLSHFERVIQLPATLAWLVICICRRGGPARGKSHFELPPRVYCLDFFHPIGIRKVNC